MKKNTHGGKRKMAGRKKIKDKKSQINLFIRQSKIEKHGGKEDLKQEIYEFLDIVE